MKGVFILSDHADCLSVSKLLGTYERSLKATVLSSATRGHYYFWACVEFDSEQVEKEFFAELGGEVVQKVTEKEISAFERGFANAFAKKK